MNIFCGGHRNDYNKPVGTAVRDNQFIDVQTPAPGGNEEVSRRQPARGSERGTLAVDAQRLCASILNGAFERYESEIRMESDPRDRCVCVGAGDSITERARTLIIVVEHPNTLARGMHGGESQCRRGSNRDKLTYQLHCSHELFSSRCTARRVLFCRATHTASTRFVFHRRFTGLCHPMPSPVRGGPRESLPRPRCSCANRCDHVHV